MPLTLRSVAVSPSLGGFGLSRGSESDITVDYATSDGTATEGNDYTDTSGTLTFAAGETEKTINVPVLEDTENEGDETVTLKLSDPSGAVLETSSATGTITNVTTTDSDQTRTDTDVTVAISSVPNEHGGSERFDFELALSSNLRVGYQAIADAVDVTGATVWKAKRNEPGSNLQWRISLNPSGQDAVNIAIPANTICDRDGAPCNTNAVTATVLGPPNVSVANAAATAEGSAATLDFTVTLSRGSESNITVDYATSDGTATEGDDYTDTSGTLTFAAGETEKTINVPVLEDTENEGDETVTLTLSGASGAVLDTSSATGTIINVATAIPDVTITLSSVPDQHGGSDPFHFNLTLSSNLQVGYQAIADAVNVTGATVWKAKRIEQGSNLQWRITLTPSGQDQVNISIDANSICDRGGTPCNTNAVSATVLGPN